MSSVPMSGADKGVKYSPRGRADKGTGNTGFNLLKKTI